jgi:hypothetical protein
MYVRAKRAKVTAFLYCEHSDKISTLKDQICSLKIEDRIVSTDSIRIIRPDDRAVLEDGQSIEEAKLENDSAIYFVFKKEGLLLFTSFSSNFIEFFFFLFRVK